MRKLFGVVAALVMVAGSAGAQVTVDYSTRTISVSASAVSPTAPSTVGGVIQRAINTQDLAGTDADRLVFRFAPMSVAGSISGFTNPAGCCAAVEASVWFAGHTDDSRIEPNGSQNGDGNEFGVGPGGSFFLTQGFVPGTTIVPYELSADVYLNPAGQGAGATATGSAFVTLAGVDAYNASGSLVRSALFYNYGDGTFASTVPEPAPLALLGTGLAALVPFVRRKWRM